MSVSCVVTARDEEKYIGECLESILNQTLPPVEVILVDDASRDRTVEIALEYPVEVLRAEHRYGTYQAKRYGIEYSMHPYVLCVDGDTYLKDDWISKALPHIQDPEVSVVTGYIHSYNSRWEWIADVQNSRPAYLSGPSYMLRRDQYLEWDDGSRNYDEIPLQRFSQLGRVVKDPQLQCYTELPTATQLDGLRAVNALTVGIPATIVAGKVWVK